MNVKVIIALLALLAVTSADVLKHQMRNTNCNDIQLAMSSSVLEHEDPEGKIDFSLPIQPVGSKHSGNGAPVYKDGPGGALNLPKCALFKES